MVTVAGLMPMARSGPERDRGCSPESAQFRSGWTVALAKVVRRPHRGGTPATCSIPTSSAGAGFLRSASAAANYP